MCKHNPDFSELKSMILELRGSVESVQNQLMQVPPSVQGITQYIHTLTEEFERLIEIMEQHDHPNTDKVTVTKFT
ncbi:hypothetical protein [Brevibacillus massiliensis]|uniref:hypothetical protein n=1 Tax=Brevibacillus massiliensis TaxID=1118054 RepID=UPI0002D9AACF|nr:hypothetical protein [Brevibacillus massiliensis]